MTFLMKMWRQIHPLKMPSVVLMITYKISCCELFQWLSCQTNRNNAECHKTGRTTLFICKADYLSWPGQTFSMSALLTDIYRTTSWLCFSTGHRRGAPARLPRRRYDLIIREAISGKRLTLETLGKCLHHHLLILPKLETIFCDFWFVTQPNFRVSGT